MIPADEALHSATLQTVAVAAATTTTTAIETNNDDDRFNNEKRGHTTYNLVNIDPRDR
jgi:hypothetical protein